MKLSEIMSAAGLSAYAEVALILFLFAFALVLLTVFSPARKAWYERARTLPLADDSAADHEVTTR